MFRAVMRGESVRRSLVLVAMKNLLAGRSRRESGARDEVPQGDRGVNRAVGDRRWNLEVIRARRKQSRAPEARHDPLLREDVLAGMGLGEAGPEVEAAGRTELRGV